MIKKAIIIAEEHNFIINEALLTDSDTRKGIFSFKDCS